VSRFDWHIAPRAEVLGLRAIDGALLGWMKSGSDEAKFMSVDPHTGQLQWSTSVSHPSLTACWLFEMGTDPQFGVFPFGDEIRAVDIRTGKLSLISVATLGLPQAIDFPPPGSTMDAGETLPALPQPPGRFGVTGMIVIVAFGWLFSGFFRTERKVASDGKPLRL
jgi:hypothetical protein